MTVSFVWIAILAAGMLVGLVLTIKADREAPGVRDDVSAAVRRAVDDDRLGVEQYRSVSVAWLVNSNNPDPSELFPRVPGARLSASRVSDDGRFVTFRYEGTDRARGHCFRGSVSRAGRVDVEAIEC